MNRLYLKIFFSFLAVLVVTMVVIFVLFLALPGKHFSARLEDFAKTKAMVIKEAVEEKIRSDPQADLSQNRSLHTFILEFGKILGARVWLENPDHSIAVKSFPGDLPKIVSRANRYYARVYGDMIIYHQRGLDLYAVIPITLSRGEKGTIHILFETRSKSSAPPLDHPESFFALGLFLIGLMAALFFVPISLFITSRLKKLRQSALAISEGNLSRRAAVRGGDEIGELALAFNQMAEKLEGLIQNSRELTAHISHELRSPLTRIRIAEEMLRNKMEQGEYSSLEGYLEGIEEDIQDLDKLIGRILDLSKLDMRDSPLTKVPLNAVSLIKGVLSRFQAAMNQKGLRLTTQLPLVVTISGDQEALATALTNLLDNAVKFTPEKGQISLRVRPLPDQLEISITNSYRRLTEEELSRIFDPFQRLKEAKATGSGLGLAIAKKIIERHGGSIKAGNVEEGLEILFFLPFTESKQ
ncbi:MAG: HAMP domain-containing sensor histidine kinase [Thermodesulfobacteriota bacterium]